MKKLTFFAAIISVAGVLASASAYAEHGAGGPVVNGNQCFTYMKGTGHDDMWGAWGACPPTASATTITTRTVTVTDSKGHKIKRIVAVQGGAQRRAAPAGGAVQFEQKQQGYWGN